MIVCKYCGSHNPDDMLYCSNCGNTLEGCEHTDNYYEQSEIPDTYSDPVYTPGNMDAYVHDPSVTGDDFKTVGLLSVIFGIVGFFLNPLYVFSLAAIVLGIITNIKSYYYKSRGIAGWILGIVSCVVQILLDIFCTMGAGIFC